MPLVHPCGVFHLTASPAFNFLERAIILKYSHFLNAEQSGRIPIEQLLMQRRTGAYSFMHSTIVHLHKGESDSWAINLAGDLAEHHRAQNGFGNSFHKVWSLEIQSDGKPNYDLINWDLILERAIYAYDMNDPLLTDFEWPKKHAARK